MIQQLFIRIIVSSLLITNCYAANVDDGNISYDQDDRAIPSQSFESESSKPQNFNQSLLVTRLEQIYEAIQKIHVKLDATTESINKIERQLEQNRESIQTNQSKAEPFIIDKNKEVVAASTSKTTDRANETEESLYQDAFQLIQAKKFNEAFEKMQLLVDLHPKSKYLPNAYYWLGEISMLKLKYDDALKHFDKVITHFPQSTKVPACLLKKGYVYIQQGQSERAKQTFNEVIQRYPETAVATLARDKLKNLQTDMFTDDEA